MTTPSEVMNFTVAATVGVGYVGYRVWEAHQNSQPKYSTQITTLVQN